jgi:hypothetical protein
VRPNVFGVHTRAVGSRHLEQAEGAMANRSKGRRRRLVGGLKATWKDAWRQPEELKKGHMVCVACHEQKPYRAFSGGNPYRCKDCGGQPAMRREVSGGLPTLGKRRR